MWGASDFLSESSGRDVRVEGRCFGVFFGFRAGGRVTESAGVAALVAILNRVQNDSASRSECHSGVPGDFRQVVVGLIWLS